MILCFLRGILFSTGKIFRCFRRSFSQIQNLSSLFCNFRSFFVRINLCNSSSSSVCALIFLLAFFHFFEIFFWRYRQLISFSSFAVAKFNGKQEFFFECLLLFSQSEIRYFILKNSAFYKMFLQNCLVLIFGQ